MTSEIPSSPARAVGLFPDKGLPDLFCGMLWVSVVGLGFHFGHVQEYEAYYVLMMVASLLVGPLGGWRFVRATRRLRRSRFGENRSRLAVRIATWTLAVTGVAVTVAMVVLPISVVVIGESLDTGPGKVMLLPRGLGIAVVGDVVKGTALRFRELVTANPSVRTVYLMSRGGRAEEALAVSRMISEKGLTTVAPYYCYSACVIIFAGGDERMISANSDFGLHRGGFWLVGSQSPAGFDKTHRRLVEIGVDENFLSKARATPYTEMWEPTVAEVLRSRLATRLEDGANMPSLFIGPRLFETDVIRRAYVKGAWPARAVSELAPGTFDKAVEWYRSALGDARQAQIVQRAFKDVLDVVLTSRLAESDDGTILAVAHVLLDGMRADLDKDSDRCVLAGTRASLVQASKALFADADVAGHMLPLARSAAGARADEDDVHLARLPNLDDPNTWTWQPPKPEGDCGRLVQAFEDDLGAPDAARRMRRRFATGIGISVRPDSN